MIYERSFASSRVIIEVKHWNSATLFIDKALSIGTFPERGRIVPELQLKSVREIIHGSYRIIYELLHDPDAVFVLRFWHAARGVPQIEPT